MNDPTRWILMASGARLLEQRPLNDRLWVRVRIKRAHKIRIPKKKEHQ